MNDYLTTAEIAAQRIISRQRVYRLAKANKWRWQWQQVGRSWTKIYLRSDVESTPIRDKRGGRPLTLKNDKLAVETIDT